MEDFLLWALEMGRYNLMSLSWSMSSKSVLCHKQMYLRNGALTVFSTQVKSEQTSKGRNGSSMKHQEELMPDKVSVLVLRAFLLLQQTLWVHNAPCTALYHSSDDPAPTHTT